MQTNVCCFRVIKLHPVFLKVSETQSSSMDAHQFLRHKSTFGLDRSAPTDTSKNPPAR